ncbi:MAG: CoA transferase [Hyphomicrobiaceae bacterium]
MVDTARQPALSGLRVLELGSMLAGPFAGTLLGDFGAEVIKAEKPGVPDALRQWPPHKGEVALWWKTMARNKKLVTLDIGTAKGRDLAERLIAVSDVVIENFKPGTMERWGLDPARMLQMHPRAVWVRVSGWGQTGPNRHRGGYATIAEGFSGLASFTGFDDRGPMVSAFPLGDYLAGIFGAFGALVALREREASGRGQVVDVALYEPFLRIIESVVVRYDQTGRLKPRLGNQMEEDVPRNIYATADGGHISISCGSDRIFQNLLRAMGRVDLTDDPRFQSMAARVQNRDVIDRIVAEWMRTQTTAEAQILLDRNDVVSGRVNDMAEVMTDPHVLARKAITTMLDGELGPVRMPSPVPQLSATPGAINWAGGHMGSHNGEVLGGILGLAPKEIDLLAMERII